MVPGGRYKCLYPQVAFKGRRGTDAFSVHPKVEPGSGLQIQGGRLQLNIRNTFYQKSCLERKSPDAGGCDQAEAPVTEMDSLGKGPTDNTFKVSSNSKIP